MIVVFWVPVFIEVVAIWRNRRRLAKMNYSTSFFYLFLCCCREQVFLQPPPSSSSLSSYPTETSVKRLYQLSARFCFQAHLVDKAGARGPLITLWLIFNKVIKKLKPSSDNTNLLWKGYYHCTADLLLGLAKPVIVLWIKHNQSSWIQIGGQTYRDTSPYEVSECSLPKLVQINLTH